MLFRSGQKVPKNTIITYVVSKGKEDKDEEDPEDPDDPFTSVYPNVSPSGEVPSVRGRSLEDALDILASEGYSGKVVEYQSSSTMVSGYVISQSVLYDGTIGLIVSDNN